MKSHTIPDGDHRITLTPSGAWAVHMIMDDPGEFPLFESTDFEACLDAVREVVADFLWDECDDGQITEAEVQGMLRQFDLRDPYWSQP